MNRRGFLRALCASPALGLAPYLPQQRGFHLPPGDWVQCRHLDGSPFWVSRSVYAKLKKFASDPGVAVGKYRQEFCSPPSLLDTPGVGPWG